MDRWLRSAYVSVLMHVNCLRLLGPAGLNLLIRSWLRRSNPVCVRVGSQEAWVRPNTTDLATLLQIYWDREYEFEIARNPGVIIDAGANVGYSTLYFATRYPKARIIAVEPHPENFAVLQKNVAKHPRITPVQAALWHEDTALGLWDPEQGHWGFRVVHADDSEPGLQIHGVSIASLMLDHALETIDLLKIDVEGSELEIFEHAAGWIDSVGALVAELHDKYRIGCARAFYNATRDFPYERHIGENILMLREADVPTVQGADTDTLEPEHPAD